ncbi:50S ribosomal protein L2 [Sulfolobus sp. F3]|nr:50S ribosomal protein L2 [Sulfolobus sp. F3]
MGKRLLQQRAGKNSPNFRSPSWLRLGKVRYQNITGHFVGKIIDILHNPGMNEPIALIKLENGIKFYAPAVQGYVIGQKIEFGKGSQVVTGNIIEIGDANEGTIVCNIEENFGDGGKYARSAGSYGVVIGKSGDKVLVRLPSGKIKAVSNKARAMVGVIAGGGITEKPLLKAGANYHKYKVKAKKWPIVRGVAMNAVDHPHGGGLHQSVSRSSTVSRNAPPGRKVGHIAARRTGRKEGK